MDSTTTLKTDNLVDIINNVQLDKNSTPDNPIQIMNITNDYHHSENIENTLNMEHNVQT